MRLIANMALADALQQLKILLLGGFERHWMQAVTPPRRLPTLAAADKGLQCWGGMSIAS